MEVVKTITVKVKRPDGTIIDESRGGVSAPSLFLDHIIN